MTLLQSGVGEIHRSHAIRGRCDQDLEQSHYSSHYKDTLP
jgi:hypothetical protein